MVILTGDIFNIPKDGDWRLKSFFSQFDLDVFITPKYDVKMGAVIIERSLRLNFLTPMFKY